jgi:hypothetical protein
LVAGLLGGLCVLGALDAYGLARALAGAGIGAGALAADGEAATMADTAIAIDGLETLEVGLHFAAEVALDGELAGGDGVDEGVELLGGEVLRAEIRVDVGLVEDLLGGARPDAVNVWEGGFDALIPGDFYS